jgi:hypothetical protein
MDNLVTVFFSADTDCQVPQFTCTAPQEVAAGRANNTWTVMRLVQPKKSGIDTINWRPVIGNSLRKILHIIRAAIVMPARWTPWIAIVTFAAACVLWKPPPLDQSWWLLVAALWAVPSGALSRTGKVRMPLIVAASCTLVFAWAFYRMQGAFMESTETWRLAHEAHAFDPVSRLFRITIAGTITAVGLGIPLTRIACRIALPIAAFAGVPYVILVERRIGFSASYWIDHPLATAIHLFGTLIPPALLLIVCIWLERLSTNRGSLLERYPIVANLIRWELGKAHAGIACVIYSFVLAAIIGGFYFQSRFEREISSSPVASLTYVLAMFLFARISVGTWRSLDRHKVRGVIARNMGELGQGTVVTTSLLMLLMSPFEAPRAGFALASAAERMGTAPWSVRVEGTVLRITGEFSPGIANAVDEAMRQNPGLRIVALDSPGGYEEDAKRTANAVLNHNLATGVSRLCASACTFVFAAGRERLLLSPGRLGFHACSPIMWFDKCDKQSELQFFKERGVDVNLVRRWQRVPNYDIWYPTIEELLAAHVITGTEIPPPQKSPALAADAQSGNK